MNKDLFRYKHRPFAATPDVVNYVPTDSIEEALDSTSSGVSRSSGPAVVIGPAGLGKSMFCVELAHRLRHSHEVVLLSTSRLCTRRALLQNILYELGLPYRESEEGELRLSLLEHLKSPQANSEGMLLIVDEAHTMPLRLLEEVRGLTNIQRQGQTRVHLVLAGTQLLDERLTNPKMEAFSQRIATRCYLHPMNREETRRYISQQWNQASADGSPVPFSLEAQDAVYSATDGIPRLVNQLCDHCLLLANVRLLKHFDQELIEEAWSDLQQLPTPWQVNFRENPSDPGQSQTVVEFGTLNEEFTASNDSAIEHTAAHQLAMERLDELDDLTRLATDSDDFDLNQNSIKSGRSALLGTHNLAELDFESDAESLEGSLAPKGHSQQPGSDDLAGGPLEIGDALLEDTHADELAEGNWEPEEIASEPEPEPEPEPINVHNPFADDDFELEELVSEQSEPTTKRRASSQWNSGKAELMPEEPAEIPFDSLTDELDSETESPRPATATSVESDLDIRGDLLPRPNELSPRGTETEAPAPPPEVTNVSQPQHPGHSDDKDMIIVDNPLPSSSLRIVGSTDEPEGRMSHAPQGMAYREDYQSLLTRLRGTMQS